jgi:hypothetical protein
VDSEESQRCRVTTNSEVRRFLFPDDIINDDYPQYLHFPLTPSTWLGDTEIAILSDLPDDQIVYSSK